MEKNLKNFCVDLEIAKELKENGFPQKSYFRYQINTSGEVEIETIEFSIHDNVTEIYSAPTSDEILSELPNVINEFWLVIAPVGEGCIVGYWENGCDNGKGLEHYFDEKLSNALSNIWLDLKKEGYIK